MKIRYNNFEEDNYESHKNTDSDLTTNYSAIRRVLCNANLHCTEDFLRLSSLLTSGIAPPFDEDNQK